MNKEELRIFEAVICAENTVRHWEKHGRYRMIEGEDIPVDVLIAKALLGCVEIIRKVVENHEKSPTDS